MKGSSGSSLSEYTIIIALIGLVVAPVIFITGQSIVTNFTAFEKGLSDKKLETDPSSASTLDPQGLPAAGSLGGTPDNPVSACENGVCTIDFGGYCS